jgi:hypothetical protein
MLDPKQNEPATPLPPFLTFANTNPWTIVNPLFWALHLPMMGFEALADVPMGGEMRAAERAARAVDAHVVLIDRPVSITLLRACGAAATAVDAKSLWAAATAPTRALATALGDAFQSSGGSSGSSTGDSNSTATTPTTTPSSSSSSSSPVDQASPLNSAWGFYRAVCAGSRMSDADLLTTTGEARALVNAMLDTVEGAVRVGPTLE